MGNNDKTLRLFHIIKLISDNSYNTNDLLIKLNENDFDISLRTLQRDLSFLKENEFISFNKNNRNKWILDNNFSNFTLPININGSEYLSFCILKSFIKSLKGTKIEQDIDKLDIYLKSIIPETAYEENVIFWDQNFGQYDYSNKAILISKLTYHIVNKNLIKVNYVNNEDVHKTFEIVPYTFYYYNGTIYLFAYYLKRKFNISLTLQNINEIELISESYINIPKFDIEKFKKNRFGVFEGDVKKIRLNINKNYIKYFENRIWHYTQKTHISPKTGNLILTMDVPITNELISWILAWSDAITIESPISLKNNIYNKAKGIAQKYEKDL